MSSWERERFLAGERRECRDTLVACVGERRNGCGDGISLSFPCPRRDIRCPARAIGGVGNPPSHTERRQFPRTVEVGSSRTRACSAASHGLSRFARNERGSRLLDSSNASDGSNCKFYSLISRRREFPRFFFIGVLRYLLANQCLSCLDFSSRFLL